METWLVTGARGFLGTNAGVLLRGLVPRHALRMGSPNCR